RFASLSASQKRRRSTGVIAGAVAVGPGLVARQAAEYQHIVLHWRERLQDRGQIEISPFLGRRPLFHVTAVGDVDERHPSRSSGFGSNFRRTQREQGFKEGQGNDRSHASQDRTP